MAAQRTGKKRRSKADREFVSEAEEILEAMRAGVADLGDHHLAGRDYDPELVNRLFRSAHSLKALAGMFRFDPIQDLAHKLEDILDGLRLGRVAVDASLIGVLEESVATFAALLERVGDTDELSSFAEAIADLTRRIGECANAPRKNDDPLARLQVDASLLRALTEYEEHRLRENVRRGRHIALVDSTFEILSFEEGLSELTTAIREHGELLSTLPAPGQAPESQINFSLLVASDLPADELLTALDFPKATVRAVLAGGNAAAASGPAPAAPAAASAGAALHDPDRDSLGAEPGAELESLRSISDTVRVDIRKLDELMNLVGELVIQRGALGELTSRLCGNSQTARVGGELAKVHKALERKLRDLQSAVLDVRMVPLRQVFEKVARVLRRMRRELDREVRLELRGADTELDKLIVEALVDPLMHVVRNAIDHAIESPDDRRRAGKDPEGLLAIEALQRGNHVVIAVRDDGRGIDLETLRARAEEKGLVQPGEQLTERETLDLIFTPGLSTRDEVTETSGRGVGMDVVRSNLASLGGVVDVESHAGRGTTITMTVPITLAIIQSLIVGVGERRFAIPLTAVLETLMVERPQIQHSEGRELLDLRGEPLLLRHLAREFALEGPGAEKPYVIVLGIGEQRVGLVVDRLHGQQDTVIKPIQGPLGTLRGIAGATDLGDQEPVLVLDASAIVDDALRRREAA
jgi:two-component system, chemotaxis family, sensor kinase CheA